MSIVESILGAAALTVLMGLITLVFARLFSGFKDNRWRTIITAGFLALSFLLGAGVMCFLATVSHRSGHMSNVVLPTRAIITDINETMREDTDLAKRKLALFEKRWKEYYSGGKAPEQFAGEIQAIGEEDR